MKYYNGGCFWVETGTTLQLHIMQGLSVFQKSFPYSVTGIFTFASQSLLHNPENSPHTGFYVPFQTAGAIKVIAGSGSAVFDFHIKSVSNTDAAL